MIKTEIEEAFSKFCFMAAEDIKDEDKDNLQQAFEDYKDSFMLAKKDKELKGIMEAVAKDNKELKDKVASLEENLEQLTSIIKDIKEELKDKNKEMLKLLDGSQKLSNILHQRSPLCKLGLGDDHHEEEFNKPLILFKASTSVQNGETIRRKFQKRKERLPKRRPPQESPHQPKMHLYVTIAEGMNTTRQDVIKGTRLNSTRVCGCPKGMFSSALTFLHLWDFNVFFPCFQTNFNREIIKMNQ